MSRFASDRRVFFWEEPIFEGSEPHLQSRVCPRTGVEVETPVLPAGIGGDQAAQIQKILLNAFRRQNGLSDCLAWYYTPMAVEFTTVLKPVLTVYDCMDELSAFAGAPRNMQRNEAALFENADLVFTGGASIYKSKCEQHNAVYSFPSSVDRQHFAQARSGQEEPLDQAQIPRPRLGYAGVIDERMDLDLLRHASQSRPDWSFVLLGPVVKIDPASLPRADNIHYLGMKPYDDLPAYFSGWDAGLLPFAMNESTRYISPTKTPEYLAAGLPVISTPIRDVITPYGTLGLVKIAADPAEFVCAAAEVLKRGKDVVFLKAVDKFLSQSSWDMTWSDMNHLIEQTLQSKQAKQQAVVSSNDRSSRSRGLSYV